MAGVVDKAQIQQFAVYNKLAAPLLYLMEEEVLVHRHNASIVQGRTGSSPGTGRELVLSASGCNS